MNRYRTPELTFDSASAEQRDRYQSIQLLLNKDANDYNNRAVEFRLEELIPNTNQWRVYEKAMYTLKRSRAAESPAGQRATSPQ